ncbi:MAG: D-alanyl-D-alanine carboxypeptidase [Actinomycetia bacterium]|nr:D-alanyl-D-alanine carboxypeptidase [Actinomycetes bacterium]
MRSLTAMCGLLAAALLLTSGPAQATVTPADLIGGATIGSVPSLQAQAPDMSVPAGVLETMDGEVLWGRAIDAHRAMASTTKIMTAIVVLETVSDLDERVTVPVEATRVGEAGVGLRAGQELSVRQLLQAMLVHSGNDAAISLAMHVAGTEDAFAQKMNAKAAELDMEDSHFTNAHGLDEYGHFTSAADLATAARYAMQDPVFRQIVSMREVSVPRKDGTSVVFEASNKLLRTYKGATGVKTGWTNDAGYCVVASAKRNGIELIAVVMGASSEEQRFSQAARLLDWGFTHYRVEQVTSAETTAALLTVSDYLDVRVPAVVAETTSVAVFDVRGPVTMTADTVSEVAAPVKRGDRVGTLSVVQGDRLLAQVPIVAGADVAEPGWWEGIKIGATRLWRKVFGGPLQAIPVQVLPTK